MAAKVEIAMDLGPLVGQTLRWKWGFWGNRKFLLASDGQTVMEFYTPCRLSAQTEAHWHGGSGTIVDGFGNRVALQSTDGILLGKTVFQMGASVPVEAGNASLTYTRSAEGCQLRLSLSDDAGDLITGVSYKPEFQLVRLTESFPVAVALYWLLRLGDWD